MSVQINMSFQEILPYAAFARTPTLPWSLGSHLVQHTMAHNYQSDVGSITNFSQNSSIGSDFQLVSRNYSHALCLEESWASGKLVFLCHRKTFDVKTCSVFVFVMQIHRTA